MPPLPLLRDNALKPSLEEFPSEIYDGDRDPDGGSKEYEHEKDKLLKSVELRKVDSIKACLGHGRHDEEKRVDVANAFWWCGRAPEDDARKQAYSDEVGIMEGNEVEGGKVGSDPGKSTREGKR